MELLIGRHEPAQLSEIVIFFGSDGPCVADLVVQSRRGDEFQSRNTALVTVVDDGIEGDAPSFVIAETPANDGTYFAGIDLLVPLPLVPTEFEIDAVVKILLGIVRL